MAQSRSTKTETGSTSLRDLLEKLKNGLDDAATLEVNTFTGTLKAEVMTEGRIDWKKLREAAPTEGELVLVASTKIYPDFDTDHYQTSATVLDREVLLAGHTTTVEAAIDARNSVLAMVAGAVGLK